MPPSWARLGSARIQLELEGFQLGLAHEIFEPARLANLGSYEPKLTHWLRPKKLSLPKNINITLDSNSDLMEKQNIALSFENLQENFVNTKKSLVFHFSLLQNHP